MTATIIYTDGRTLPSQICAEVRFVKMDSSCVDAFRHGTGAAMYVVGRFQPDTLMTGVLLCRSDEP